MSPDRKEWWILLACMGVALLAWFTRGTPSIGGRVAYLFTIVPADGSGTACASDASIDTYHCEFDQAAKPAGSARLLRPFVSVSGERVLLAGVFDGHEMAQWLTLAKEKGSTERVTVRCAGRWIGVMREAGIRWTPTSPWGSAGGLPAVVVETCSVAK